MLKDETPLIDVYYAQHIADSMGCNQQQKDVIISKALLQMLERLAMPLNSYGLDLAEHSISSEVLREKVYFFAIYWSLIRESLYCWMSGELGVPRARRL